MGCASLYINIQSSSLSTKIKTHIFLFFWVNFLIFLHGFLLVHLRAPSSAAADFRSVPASPILTTYASNVPTKVKYSTQKYSEVQYSEKQSTPLLLP